MQIPIIVVLSYLIGELYKMIFKESLYKYIPIIVSIIGGIIGIIMYVTNSLNVNNFYDSLLIGIISGSSSTGTNQIIKQIFMKEKTNE